MAISIKMLNQIEVTNVRNIKSKPNQHTNLIIAYVCVHIIINGER